MAEVQRQTERTSLNSNGDKEPTRGESRILVASQWQLMWWKFRKHKLALAGTVVISLLLLSGLFCEFWAPYDPNMYDQRYAFAPPTRLRFVRPDGFHLRPFVYGLKSYRSTETYMMVVEEDRSVIHPVRFFVRGAPYKMWNLFEMDVNFFGLEDPEGRIFLLGTDRMGRDMMSRIFYGARISLSIGLIGVFLSFVLGILIGGVSGYYGGLADVIIQRVMEFLRSMPSIPLWMALSAALPPHWPTLRIYFGITVILSLIGWTWLARTVRGQFLALRGEDFVTAARLAGAGEMRIILRHLVPSFLSYIIASITLSIPGMILAETSLSFLGLGLQPPVISWGVLLKEAQDVRTVALAPWLLLPGVFVTIAVLAFNFMGDGVRDAADPYAR
jgi:peptide/nickel transport system permease protein